MIILIDVMYVVYDLKASDTSIISKTMLLPSHSSCCHSPRYQRLQLVQSVRVASSWTPGRIPLIWSISLGSYATWLDFWPQNLGHKTELLMSWDLRLWCSGGHHWRSWNGRSLGEMQSWLFNRGFWLQTGKQPEISPIFIFIYIHQYRKSVSILWMRQEFEDLEANRKSWGQRQGALASPGSFTCFCSCRGAAASTMDF